MNNQDPTHTADSEDESETPTVVIGITGNIGSGKSTVAKHIAASGARVFSSDETAQRLMNEDADLKLQLQRNFGPEIYDDAGVLQKKVLASLIFGVSPEHHARLALLNRLVHPRVLEEHQRQIEECASQGISTVFIESALIYEVGLDEAFDYIIVVDAPEALRLQRAMQRLGATEEEIRHRMRQQLSAQEKTKYADFVLDNSSTPEVLQSAISSLLPILVMLPPRTEDETSEDVD